MKRFQFTSFFMIITLLLVCVSNMNAKQPLTYFLDDIEYDDRVPSPEDFLGYQIGEWHLQHHILVQYMEVLAETSGRAVISEYARSHEFRPLVEMVITSEENQARLEEIRANHLRLTDPEVSADIDIRDMPLVVRLGYGVHGNEASSHNAAPLVAYYLAAGQGDKVQELLDNMVVIIDPSLNPDGQDRYASWVNRHKSTTPNPDPNNREASDAWPGSRTNHYWFDLNRDWLPLQHPESQGRVEAYHRWKPNINTDHHEFGSASTFFFQPGEPARVNPRTPRVTDELTMEVAKYHAEAFDAIGQTYYTQQGFDDFYYGKGSTYPDVQGSIGILFEQASSRGYQRETVHGTLDFAQTIRNQVLVSMSSMRAGLDMRERLLDHLRWFYTSAMDEADDEDFEAYIFGQSHDSSRNRHLLEVLKTHQVDVYHVAETFSVEGHDFEPGHAWLVPLKQPQYRLIQSMFEKTLTFEDSLFYDVSAWTKPLAFNIPYEKINSTADMERLKADLLDELPEPTGRVAGGKSDVAYVFGWEDYYAPKALYQLQKNELRTHVATEPFRMETAAGEKAFDFGSIMVPVKTQDIPAEQVYEKVNEAAQEAGITIHAVQTSFVSEGIHLGSRSFTPLTKPEVLMLVGSGTSSREAGEAWHLLDQRHNMPVTKVELRGFSSVDLERYNVVVMVSGSYKELDEDDREKLDRWNKNGGVIVGISRANKWLDRNEFVDIEFVDTPEQEDPEMLPYHIRPDHRGARRISGAIFQTRLDTSHPIGYGYQDDSLPVFVSGTLTAAPDENPFANPVLFTDDALLSGYAWEHYKQMKDGTAAVLIHRNESGGVVSIMQNPNFRGFWFGTNKLFMNALYFGQIMRN